MKKLIYLLVLPFLAMNACDKDELSGDTHFAVRMTDAPADYDAVNVEVVGVKVHTDQDGWTDLNVNPGIYNLLELTGGKDTLIASANLSSGDVTQVRMILGENNTIVVDGETHDLHTPSAKQSGLKKQIKARLMPNIVYTLLLDFDVARSIHETGNGKYILKPVIRPILDNKNGFIKGRIEPATAAVVYAIRGGDSVSTITNSRGEFRIHGLDGRYDVLIDPVDPWKDVTIEDVRVKERSSFNLRTIQLTK